MQAVGVAAMVADEVVKEGDIGTVGCRWSLLSHVPSHNSISLPSHAPSCDSTSFSSSPQEVAAFVVGVVGDLIPDRGHPGVSGEQDVVQRLSKDATRACSYY